MIYRFTIISDEVDDFIREIPLYPADWTKAGREDHPVKTADG